MTNVDFLPAAYRQRLQQRRVRRERTVLLLLILSGVVATDVLFRRRIAGLRRMEELASRNADLAEQRRGEATALAHRVERLESELARRTVAFRTPRISELVDDLIVRRPPGVKLLGLECQVEPTSDDAEPRVQLDAACGDVTEFSEYLAALRASALLPWLDCKRTDPQRSGGGQSFRLETARRTVR